MDGSVSPARVKTVVQPSASICWPADGAKHSLARRISEIDRMTAPVFFQAGSSACSRCLTTLPRLGRSLPATAPTAWIMALSRSSLILGSSSRSVSVAMVRFSARSVPNENGSSSPGAAELSGSTRARLPCSVRYSASGSASPFGSIATTVAPRSASW